jgi:arylsulfatase A-like enzyme
LLDARYRSQIYNPLPPQSHLPKDAPNIIIVLIDDVGPAQTDTYGGEIHTPTLSRIAQEGISYNRFHTTAMCSPTRAALLTGRNHQRVGAGQIAELANDWDGYSGIQPKTSAMMAEVLKDYGYSTAAWGKWHNTPAEQTTAAGPFDYWPTGYGFEYFYGFLAGEASQYEPNLVRNTATVHPPKTSGGHNYYHLSEDLADNAIGWLQDHKAFAPDNHSSCTGPAALPTVPIKSRRSGPTNIKASSMTVGTNTGSGFSRGRKQRAIFRQTHNSRRGRKRSRHGTRFPKANGDSSGG